MLMLSSAEANSIRPMMATCKANEEGQFRLEKQS
jgi:hypothetical protein